MSFSGDIKKEISQRLPDEYHCLLAEIAAMLHYAGTVKGTAEHGSILLETENVVLARKYLRLLKKAFDISVNLEIERLPSGKNHKYRVLVSDEVDEGNCERGRAWNVECEAISGGTDAVIWNCDGKSDVLQAENRVYEAMQDDGMPTVNVGDKFSRVFAETADWERPGFRECLLEYPCCRRAFVRGAFLASGSVSDPRKSYHFEIVCRKRQGAEELSQILQTFDVFPGIVERKNKYVIYLKDSEAIVDVLNVMGAPRALMRLENLRIVKEMKNSANRQYNCDSANINKMVRTAARQTEDIRYIERHMGLAKLRPQLREMALVRLEHPEESLADLGTYLDPPVGKSGVNHRLKKLGEIAQNLRDGQNGL